MSYPAPAGPSLLLCDDAESERVATARILRSAGYVVHEADNGASALRFLKSHEIDLVLLDLNMPQIDGFGVLGYLQEHRRALPVVLLSGMSPSHIQPRIHHLPDSELPPLLLKPVDPDQLLAVIEWRLTGDVVEGGDSGSVSPSGDDGSVS